LTFLKTYQEGEDEFHDCCAGIALHDWHFVPLGKTDGSENKHEHSRSDLFSIFYCLTLRNILQQYTKQASNDANVTSFCSCGFSSNCDALFLSASNIALHIS